MSVCTDIEQVLWQNPLADTLLCRPAGTGLDRSLTWRLDYDTPAVLDPALRRRPAADRATA